MDPLQTVEDSATLLNLQSTYTCILVQLKYARLQLAAMYLQSITDISTASIAILHKLQILDNIAVYGEMIQGY